MLDFIHRFVVAYRVNFSLYFLVGGVSALVEWTVFLACLKGLGSGYETAAVLGFVVATGVNYLLSERFVFALGKRTVFERTLLTFLASMIGFGVNYSVFVVLVEQVSAPLLPAKIMGTGTAFVWNFLARQFFVFNSDPRGARQRWRVEK